MPIADRMSASIPNALSRSIAKRSAVREVSTSVVSVAKFATGRSGSTECNRLPDTASEGIWIGLGADRILHCLHARPGLHLVLRIRHIHRRVRYFAKRYLFDVRHHSDDRPCRIPGRPDAYLFANGILSRPELLCHGTVNDGHRNGAQDVSVGDVPSALQRRADGGKVARRNEEVVCCGTLCGICDRVLRDADICAVRSEPARGTTEAKPTDCTPAIDCSRCATC